MEQVTVNGRPINYSGLPQHIQEGMQLYIEHKIAPGGFLTAVLCNDLYGAAVRADEINKHLLFEYVNWLDNHAPQLCWGNPKRVKEWLES